MISVVITVYNKAPWLRRCLDSVVNQTDKEHQVIIVDDGSTDGGGAMCDKYKEHGFEVYHTKNKGVSAARNYGIRKAKGDYITFMDADDAYEPNAFEVMERMSKDGKYNIIQFGQYGMYGDAKSKHNMDERGDYKLPDCVDYWEFTTNKLYKLKFVRDNKLKFIEGLQFGEDEMFNVDAFIANHGVRQSAVVLYRHYFDDTNSLCRGGLDIDKLKHLEQMLRDKLVEVTKTAGKGWTDNAEWLIRMLNRHYNSRTFKRFGFSQKSQGNYDIVYFVKECPNNDELRYSLRSVEENFSYKDVWFYGGCPSSLSPDHFVKVRQNAPTKWENVRNMMLLVCKNEEITGHFWLFNDDFFILKPTKENMLPKYDGTLSSKIQEVKDKTHGEGSEWSENLERLRKLLLKEGKTEYCYAVHVPMLIDRHKMVEVLEKYPHEPMIRALYGNMCGVGGEQLADPKYSDADDRNIGHDIAQLDMVSTSDDSFRAGYIGRWLRDKFQERSRFENDN